MAIDSELKRRRAIDATGMWFAHLLPVPAGILTAAERYDILGLYSSAPAGSVWIDTEKPTANPWTDA